jgi:hypothetical protein
MPFIIETTHQSVAEAPRKASMRRDLDRSDIDPRGNTLIRSLPEAPMTRPMRVADCRRAFPHGLGQSES